MGSVITYLRAVALILAIIFFSQGCRRDGEVHSGGAVVLSPYLLLSADTSCIIVPNVFTPLPDDGINTDLRVTSRNMASLEMIVLSMDGDTLYRTDDMLPSWNGNDPNSSDASADLGRYQIHIHGITTSGVSLDGQSEVVAMAYTALNCLPVIGIPLCGDQLDPRRCDIHYASNEAFCE